MAADESNNDCYFYYYSSCAKGDDCPYRHCEAALGTEIVCSLWRVGRCFRSNCKFRHLEIRKNRTVEQCYWENQPGGCRKPHCVYFHKKPRCNMYTSSENQGWILPVSASSALTIPSTKVVNSKGSEFKDLTSTTPSVNSDMESNGNNNATNNHDGIEDNSEPIIPQTVEPFVVSIDEEESDSESLSSTPMKSSIADTCINATSVKKKLNEIFEGKEENNYGIKTLEQIRMEKIHKESEHFYKSVFDAPLMAPDEMKMAHDSPFKQECYPAVSDFISLTDRPVDKSSTGESNHQLPANENDLRKRLKRKAPVYTEDNIPSPPKKIVSLKTAKEEDPLNFKIKTLDEIRKERENKSGGSQVEVSNTSKICPSKRFSSNSIVCNNTVSDRNISEFSNGNEKIQNDDSSSTMANGKGQKPKIKRQSIETLSNQSIMVDSSNGIQKKENRSQMILHEVQNISEDQNKTDVIKGKRKETDDSSDNKSIKLFKSDSSLSSHSSSLPHISNEAQNNANEDKQIKKLRRPIIRRNITSPLSPVLSNNSTFVSESENSALNSKSTELLSPPVKEEPSIKEECVETSKVSDKGSVKETVRTSSVDELESFLNGDVTMLDDVESPAEKETEDILLEIEQLLES